ncbi:leucine-rich repeat-containing protein 15-like [Harmonia axyridis]|uniref:leucine-rich repeat-containing protein 15-like n=1 Tax=Harmonia axyridis TaxID=115357 RepID=UPI001E277160|nr:leucine-rich repeat-containing protein 15-like [Harmonia axyridis]
MFFIKSVLLLCLFCYVRAEHLTFKNVTVHGYSAFNHKFKQVIVSSNYLKDELPRSVFDAVEIRHQDIPVLYENCISDISALDELILEENNIQEIEPGAFKNLSQIRLIKLKKNHLKTITEGIFNNLPVSDLDLSQNEISVIEDKALDNMPNLLNIRLTLNKITTWNSNWFKATPLLTRLSFQRNLIKELPSDAFSNMAGTKSFGKIPLTLNLLFSNNKISRVDPHTFRGLNKINNLWLDNNLLEEYPPKMLNKVSVHALRISNNKLKCIDDKESLLKAEINDIDANPFDCDCLSDIKNWAEKNNKSVSTFYADMNCYAERLEGKMRDIEKLLK